MAPAGRGHTARSTLSAVTDYLGITAAQLRTQLEAGKSLADVAKAQGKTVAGLQDAIVAAATKKLDAAVAAGKLTAAQKATMLADLEAERRRHRQSHRPAARGPGGAGGHGHGPFGAAAGSSSGTATTTMNRVIVR